MSQSRAGSAVEAVVNVAIGLGVAVAAQYAVFPLFGIPPMPAVSHVGLACVFTALSVVRTYVVRRCAERLQVRAMWKRRLVEGQQRFSGAA